MKGYVLFSGGKDSLATAHYMMNRKEADGCLFLDTGIRTEETVQYVRETCDTYGWPLATEKTPYDYDELVMKFGFPTRRKSHNWFMNYLKTRGIRQFTRRFPKEDVILFSGVRRGESRRRFGTAKPVSRFERAVLKSPIIDWPNEKVWTYIRDNALPVNPVYSMLHISGDCLCGAFAQRGEAELILSAFPTLAERIRGLEKRRSQVSTQRCRWGNYEGISGSRGLERFLCAECPVR